MKIQIRDFGKVPSKSTSKSKIALFFTECKKNSRKKNCNKMLIFGHFPMIFYLKEQQVVEKGRKECSETSSYLGRQKCLTC